jgi:hypothetical protein
MSAHVLPPPERLATLVSSVTTTMLNISFLPDAGRPARPTLVWRTAMLPIAGARPLTIGLSSDQEGCVALSSAMFSVEPVDVDNSMINDALCELVNMTAGLVKGALSLDQALGLPRIVEDAATYAGAHSVVLRAKGLGLVLWIHEGV